MEQESLRSALRRRTRGLHTRLDASLTGPDGRVADLPGYLRLLTILHGLHAHADEPLARWAHRSPLASGLDAALVPARADGYAADLATLGVEADPVAPPPRTPVPDARGLALLYVVAGSSIGARVVLRGLPDVVPADARRGLTDAAGAPTTALWRQAQAVLSRPVSRELHEAVVAEAGALLGLLLHRRELLAS